MKLKIILLLLVAIFTLSFALPSVNAGEVTTTTTQEETTTTAPLTTVDPIQAAIDAQLAKAQSLIMGFVVSVGGASTVGGVVAGFLTKKRKQIDTQLAVAKADGVEAKNAYDKGKAVLETKFDIFQQKTETFQEAMLSKYENAITKANEQTAKATAIIAKYQAREAELAAFLKQEALDAQAKVQAEIVAGQATVVSTATDAISKVSAECGEK